MTVENESLSHRPDVQVLRRSRESAKLRSNSTNATANRTEINHEDNAEIRWYSFRGFLILVGMDQGISQCEVFRKVDNARMSDAEIRALLEANVGAMPWRSEPDDNANNIVYWSRDKKSRLGIYTLATHNLLITSKPFLKRFANLVISNERKKMEGF